MLFIGAGLLTFSRLVMWKRYVGFSAKLRHIVTEVQCAGASAEAERLLTIKSIML